MNVFRWRLKVLTNLLDGVATADGSKHADMFFFNSDSGTIVRCESLFTALQKILSVTHDGRKTFHLESVYGSGKATPGIRRM